MKDCILFNHPSAVTTIPRTGIGRSMRRFFYLSKTKPCVLAGVIIDNTPGFLCKTDGDVIFESIASAISTVCEFNYKEVQEELALAGVTTSYELLVKAIQALLPKSVVSVAVCIEGKSPQLTKNILLQMKKSIAELFQFECINVGITTITGDGLDECGCGEGIDCITAITVV